MKTLKFPTRFRKYLRPRRHAEADHGRSRIWPLSATPDRGERPHDRHRHTHPLSTQSRGKLRLRYTKRHMERLDHYEDIVDSHLTQFLFKAHQRLMRRRA